MGACSCSTVAGSAVLCVCCAVSVHCHVLANMLALLCRHRQLHLMGNAMQRPAGRPPPQCTHACGEGWGTRRARRGVRHTCRGWPCIALRALPVSLRGCGLTSMHALLCRHGQLRAGGRALPAGCCHMMQRAAGTGDVPGHRPLYTSVWQEMGDVELTRAGAHGIHAWWTRESVLQRERRRRRCYELI